MVHKFLFGLIAILVAVTMVKAYPVPAGVPFRWEFQFESGPFRLFVDEESGESFWYLTYTVMNRTNRDRIWAPKFTLFTDSGEILESGKNVPSRIVNDIFELMGNELLETQNEIIGDLLQGPENAREGLVVWPARVLNVNEISMFIAGISGETIRVRNPITGELVILYKTLHRKHLIPGDAQVRGSRPIELVEESWILR